MVRSNHNVKEFQNFYFVISVNIKLKLSGQRKHETPNDRRMTEDKVFAPHVRWMNNLYSRKWEH